MSLFVSPLLMPSLYKSLIVLLSTRDVHTHVSTDDAILENVAMGVAATIWRHCYSSRYLRRKTFFNIDYYYCYLRHSSYYFKLLAKRIIITITLHTIFYIIPNRASKIDRTQV